jgi:hypothetical protein
MILQSLLLVVFCDEGRRGLLLYISLLLCFSIVFSECLGYLFVWVLMILSLLPELYVYCRSLLLMHSLLLALYTFFLRCCSICYSPNDVASAVVVSSAVMLSQLLVLLLFCCSTLSVVGTEWEYLQPGWRL